MSCPWCEIELSLEAADEAAGEGTCPECQTTWAYEDERPAELPLAA